MTITNLKGDDQPTWSNVYKKWTMYNLLCQTLFPSLFIFLGEGRFHQGKPWSSTRMTFVENWQVNIFQSLHLHKILREKKHKTFFPTVAMRDMTIDLSSLLNPPSLFPSGSSRRSAVLCNIITHMQWNDSTQQYNLWRTQHYILVHY